jgi:YebC/PmpR family DNA-binding regulatory protein
MAGHSHWAGIKHKKALIDNKRGKLWSRLSKAIMIAAKMGGGDPASNIRLRTAILDAKAVSVPKENIERAIKKGTGELEGGDVEEILYEGYGPSGVAILCEIMTDNRNRTAPEIRKIFELHGGKLGATNCVAWMFERRGLFLVPQSTIQEETLINHALEAGALDVRPVGENFEICCEVDRYAELIEALENAKIDVVSKQLTRIPRITVDIDMETARTVLKLLEALDDHDDVQSVAANFSMSDESMREL